MSQAGSGSAPINQSIDPIQSIINRFISHGSCLALDSVRTWPALAHTSNPSIPTRPWLVRLRPPVYLPSYWQPSTHQDRHRRHHRRLRRLRLPCTTHLLRPSALAPRSTQQHRLRTLARSLAPLAPTFNISSNNQLRTFLPHTINNSNINNINNNSSSSNSSNTISSSSS